MSQNHHTAGLYGRALRQWLVQESVFFGRPKRVFAELTREQTGRDLVAGLTLAVVLLPQAIAYSLMIGLPPQMGVNAAIVATIVGALWGSSNQLNTGPTNTTSLLVMASLLAVSAPSSESYIAAAGLMAVMVGVIRLAMGLLRMGVLVNFVSDSVIIGFTAGAGILIGANQLRHLLRLDLPRTPDLGLTLGALMQQFVHTHLPSLAVGLGTIVIIVLLKRFWPRVPAALVGMLSAAVIVAAFHLEDAGVMVLGGIPRSLPPLTQLPLLDFALIRRLLPGALAVASIGLVESTSIARSVAAKTGQRLDSNQEFVGQGLANICVGFLSGYAVSGSFTRTAVAHEAGARSPLAAVFSGLLLLVMMFLVAPLAVHLPLTALAAVLLVTAWRMVDRQEMSRIVRTSPGDTWTMYATMAATLLLPLAYAVLTGVLVSFARYLIKTSTPGVMAVVPDERFHHFVRATDRTVCPQLGVMEIGGSLFFGAVRHTEDALWANQEANPGQMFLLLRMHFVDVCDVSGIRMLDALVRRYRACGGDVFLEGVRPDVQRMISQYGFTSTLGAANILNTGNSITHLFHKVLHPDICIYGCSHRVFGECQGLPKDAHALQRLQLDAVTDRPTPELAPSEARFLLADPDSDVIIVDVGETGEYRNWHIEDAFSLPLRRLTAEGPHLPAESTLIFVSRMGRRGALAVHIMQNMNRNRVYNLRGGMLAWEAAGFPIAVE